MQTWITEKNSRLSASKLDRQRLFANIYESIHQLASNMGVAHCLATPKRNVSNHPACKLWKNNDYAFLDYIYQHLLEWEARGYKSPTNWKNFDMLSELLNYQPTAWDITLPKFVIGELIETHRSVLYQKNPTFYVGKWANIAPFLKMRYDWNKGE